MRNSTSRSFVLSFLFLLLSTTLVSAQEETPCLEKQGTRWKINNTRSCVQLTAQEHLKFLEALRTLQFYKKDYEPKCELSKQQYIALDKKWSVSEQLWKQQEQALRQIADTQQGIAKKWEEGFWKLTKEKVPPRSWTESPLLWVGVGVAITAIGFGVGVAIYGAIVSK